MRATPTFRNNFPQDNAHQSTAKRLYQPWALRLCRLLLEDQGPQTKDALQKESRIIEACIALESSREAKPFPKNADLEAKMIATHSNEIAHDLALLAAAMPTLPPYFPIKLQEYYLEGHQYIASPQALHLMANTSGRVIEITKVELDLRNCLSRMHPYPPLEMQDLIIVPCMLRLPTNARVAILQNLVAANKYGLKHETFAAYVEQLDLYQGEIGHKKIVASKLNNADIKDFIYIMQNFGSIAKASPHLRSPLVARIIQGDLQHFQAWLEKKMSRDDSAKKHVNTTATIGSSFPTDQERVRMEFTRALREESKCDRPRSIDELYRAFKGKSGPSGVPPPVEALEKAFRLLRAIASRRQAFGNDPDPIALKREVLHCRSHYPLGSDRQKVSYFAAASSLFHHHFGQYPYDTQLVATLLFSDSKILESKNPTFTYRGAFSEVGTGEGKSLLTALQAPFQVSQNRQVDILTSNNYLAERDSMRFEDFFADLGVTSSHQIFSTRQCKINSPTSIVYSTPEDRIFQILRAKFGIGSVVDTRTLDFAIVDEADLALLPQQQEICRISVANIDLVPEEMLSEFLQFVDDSGPQAFQDNLLAAVAAFKEFCPEAKSLSDIRVALHLQSALTHRGLELDKHYINRDGEIVVVDVGNSGRLLRTQWLHGNNRFVAIRDNLKVPSDSCICGQMSKSQLLGLYGRLLCISGSIGDDYERKEVSVTQNLINFDIPPHHPKNLKRDPFSFMIRKEKWMKKIEEVAVKCTSGPSPHAVEFFTDSISGSREQYNILKPEVPRIQLLNDVDNLGEHGVRVDESQIIENIGALAMVSISTGAGGRGADPRLHETVLNNGGLKVVLTHYPSSERVQKQEEGRAARQGEAGSTRTIMCAENDHFLNHMAIPGVKPIILEIAEYCQSNSQKMERSMELVRNFHAIVGCRTRMIVHSKQQLIFSVQKLFDEFYHQTVDQITDSNSGAFRSPNHIQKFTKRQLGRSWSHLFDEFALTIENFDILKRHNTWARSFPISPFYEKLLTQAFERASRNADHYIELRYGKILRLYQLHISALETHYRPLTPSMAKILTDEFHSTWSSWVSRFAQRASYMSATEVKFLQSFDRFNQRGAGLIPPPEFVMPEVIVRDDY